MLRERSLFKGEETQRMKAFCRHHMQTEQAHLDVMLELVPESNRTKLQPVWFVAARGLGFLPALLGPRALYWTIASVETFVEEHYQHQVSHVVCQHSSFSSCLPPSSESIPTGRLTFHAGCPDCTFAERAVLPAGRTAQAFGGLM